MKIDKDIKEFLLIQLFSTLFGLGVLLAWDYIKAEKQLRLIEQNNKEKLYDSLVKKTQQEYDDSLVKKTQREYDENLIQHKQERIQSRINARHWVDSINNCEK